MRIAVVYNEPKACSPRDHWLSRSGSEGTVVTETFTDASEYGVLEEAQLIASFVREAGHEAVLHAVDDPGGLWEFLGREQPDLIFNCCESLRGDARLEMNVAAIFEILGIPFTGSPALTLGMALNKNVAKRLFAAHDVPTPRWAVVSPDSGEECAAELNFPLIVKPLEEDASIGIDTHSVVADRESLRARVRFVWSEFRQPALVEEFIDGRELNVALLATSQGQFATLPVSEILFEGFPKGQYPILTYEAKWIEDSPYFLSTVSRCPAELDAWLEERVRSIALKAASALQLRDYGRIDIRVRGTDGAVFVLEANPNPAITPESGFIRAAQASGRTYAGVICEIVERAVERMRAGGPAQ